MVYVNANKKAILQKITNVAAKEINGRVSIGDVQINFFKNFPGVLVSLHEVMITDSMYAQHHHVFFKGEEVVLKMGIAQFIRKNPAIDGLSIANGDFYLFTDTTGYSNNYLLQPKKESGKKNKIPGEVSKSISLENVNIILENNVANNRFDVLANNLKLNVNASGNSINISSEGQLLIRGIALYVPDGEFLAGKKLEGNFDLKFDKALQKFWADSISIKIDDHPFTLSFSLDQKKTRPEYDLNIYTKDIHYPDIKSLLTPALSKALSVVSLDSKIDAEAHVRGALEGGEPLITAKWKVKDSYLSTPLFKLKKATFSASYSNDTNSLQKNKNGKIEITNFSTD